MATKVVQLVGGIPTTISIDAPALSYLTKTSDYTVVSTDRVVAADCTSNNVTFTISASPNDGDIHTFIKKDSTNNSMSVILADTSKTIMNSDKYSTSVPLDTITVIALDGNFYKM